MKNGTMRRRGWLTGCAVALALALMGWVVGDQWSRAPLTVEAPARGAVTGFPAADTVVTQRLNLGEAVLDSLTVAIAPVGDSLGGAVRLRLLEGGDILIERTLALTGEAVDSLTVEGLSTAIHADTVAEWTLLDSAGDGLTPALWLGDSVDTGRFSVAANDLDGLTVNGEVRTGRLCMAATAHRDSGIMRWYWPVCALLALCCPLCGHLADRKMRRGGRSVLYTLRETREKYAFLLEQLVSRNFRTKYRQSVLGVLWSFLNPLLTMAVQYVIFSTLFRSAIPNFPVYLISGIILFNFFTEAANLGLDSIVTSGPLLTKVAMPKYIFPVSRTVSAVINLVISLVPLLGLMALTGVAFTRALLLIPLLIVFTFGFALGMALLLSTLYVFFRDIKFLWSVVVLLWTYATPIFYPESIIPARILPIFRLNPMYQFITFLRQLTLYGTVPQPRAFLACALCAAVPLAIGLIVFRRREDAFVFHL